MAITARPAGSWPTPITSELLVSAAVRLSEVRVDRADLLWSEGRPAEGGRTQLVRRRDGVDTDLLPEGFDARTGVHEYGGGSWWVRDGVVWFVNWADQRLYRLDPADDKPGALTATPARPRGDRYADGEVSPDGASIVCIRERHPVGGNGAMDVRNEIVRLAAHRPTDVPEVLVSGPDFVSAPRLSPDGGRLAYLRWNHPSMPWDATELVTLRLADHAETVIAGGPGESVVEPLWGPDGELYLLSDRNGWWNLYRWNPHRAEIEPVVRMDAEIGVPGWVLGSARYAVLADGHIVFARQRDGYDGLVVRRPDGQLTELELPFSWYGTVRDATSSQPDDTQAGDTRAASQPGDTQADTGVLVIAGGPTGEPEIARIGLDGTRTTLRPPRDLGLDPGYLSVPEHVSFPSTAPDGTGWAAHALFYPPTNPAYRLPAGERPPLLVVIHGGPTASAVPMLSLGVQYWTSRGFAVVDVNYGGSTGYGREYRERLLGNWGLVDVADCLAAARWLAEQGRVDGARLCIRGGSAGGYTTLAALVREDTPFAAGADHFGVSDLAALAADTHKFESRYLDRLVGPYPAAAEVYAARSPITQVHRLTRPLIVLQGSEDAVVPPSQSELIVEALRDNGVPVAYLLFEGEQHGFRRAENIRRACDAELSFYGQVFGFALPADEEIDPVPIENLARRSPIRAGNSD